MIPPEIYADCPSRGERELFQRLRDSPATRDWIVLHSLDIANHVKQVAGEIDFVCIVPGKGVLCVEVKACKSVHRREGKWFYGAHDMGGDVRGPFKQAAEGMHSLRSRVTARRPDLSRIVFWSCVVFTDCRFNSQSEEWHPWQVVDTSLFISRPISATLERVLDSARAHLATCQTATWFYPGSAEPYKEQADALANLLRPDFEFYESPKAQATLRAQELKRYTEEQLTALDAMEANPRVAFVGPAGTGKTLLAIEAARRASSAGSRVMLLCYNNHLGRWLERETENLRPQLQTGTLHKQMIAVSGLSNADIDDRTEFWSDELPSKAIDSLLSDKSEHHVYDEIILDEGQDILRSNYLDFLDLSLKGGLAAGRWRFFGDFEKQNIYDAANISLDEAILTRVGQAPIFSLRVNCRNTPRVAELVHLLGGLTPGYSRVLRPDDGSEPKLLYYSDPEEQQILLVRQLEELEKSGFAGSDIVVLSTRAGTSSAASQMRVNPWRERLQPLPTSNSGQIGYSSIHSFKGLEAGAIIVTDVENITGASATALFYIAVTRALHRLTLLIHESTKNEIVQALLKPRL
ncbi:MAG TPA: NERD domain-containing protein [Pyrinomonadaceae bacterium]|nr:NERD domain-containing protein [Pyrinomonadaceae bacterium]